MPAAAEKMSKAATTKKKTVKPKPAKAASRTSPKVASTSTETTVSDLRVEEIVPNPLNPRKTFDDASLAELVASVKEKGVLQPIIVRKNINPGIGGQYELVAGERRWRAATIAGLEKIPAIVRELDDSEAFDIMSIENIIREDLTEAEEARSFKAYADMKGPGAIEDLAQRSGISARYIRRRVKIMELPDFILKEWEEGKIGFGVLEQLLRLDPGTVEEFHKEYMGNDWGRSIDRVRNNIDRMAIPVGCALFKTKDAGCTLCPYNSRVQASLFGDDFAEKKAKCLNPSCFVENQRKYLTDNWPNTKYAKDWGTNGFRFQEDIDYNKYNVFFSGKPREQCANCSSFVSLISWRGQVHHEKACVDPACFKTKSNSKDNKSDTKQAKNHGPEFQDRFYRERIPQLESTLPFEDERVLRLVARSLLNATSACADAFKKACNIESSWYTDKREIWLALEKLSRDELIVWIRKAALHHTLEGDQMGNELSMKHAVAKHFGIDLARDWTLHKDYLQRKTITEILDMCKDLGIFTDPKVKEYAAGTLGLRNEKYGSLKKKDLILLIVESGVDLTGKVPKEILKTE